MRLFSADSHVNEPPQTWERVPNEFRDRGPRIVQDPPGLKGLYFIVEGLHPEPVGITFLAGKDIGGGKIAKEIDEFDWNHWQGPWNSAERLKDMDLDGVEAEVIYPSMARILNGLNDAPLQTASLKAYNDWLHEYCSHAPKRLIALAVLSVLDIEWSIKELQRCAKLGFKGVILPSALPDGESYSLPRFDPLWEAAQEIGLPVSFHENTAQGRDRGASARMGNTLLQRFRWRIGAFIEPQILLVDLIFGLVLEKYPRLQFVFAEYELCWLGIILNMDANVGRMISPSSAKIAMLPSEYIKRQIHLTFLRDRIGAFIEPQILLVDLIFGLVLERYPRLQFVFAEYELCWLGIILNMDANVGRMISPSSAKIAMLPSEYIKRQIHLTFLRDRIGALGTEVFGADTYMWSSDYPHRVSTWPKSQETAQRVLKGLPETVQRRLAWENGSRLYGI